jgi:hypothetical protein
MNMRPLIGAVSQSKGEVHDQTMIPRDEIPRRDRPSFALRSQPANVISPSHRGLHRGQRRKPRLKAEHMTAPFPRDDAFEKVLAWWAVPHMRKIVDTTGRRHGT